MPRRKFKSARKSAGMSPGSLVYVGEHPHSQVLLRALTYSPDIYKSEVLNKFQGLPLESAETRANKYWLDTTGLSQTDFIKSLGEQFKLHPLSLEDLLNTNHRPKIDDFDDYIFIILKVISFNAETLSFKSDQLALALGSNFVLSFHETPLSLLNPIYQRLELGRGRIRKMPPDYLAYAIIDAVVDDYFIAFELLDQSLEQLHQKILTHPESNHSQVIHQLKRELQALRHDLLPLRDVLGLMLASDSELLHSETQPFIKDLNDHVLHAISELENARDSLNELAQYSMMVLSTKVAEVTKVLTLIASIFIPLTFIVGVYGMNFQHMPELQWRYGYYFIWLIMLALSLGLIYYFKRKKWF